MRLGPLGAGAHRFVRDGVGLAIMRIRNVWKLLRLARLANLDLNEEAFEQIKGELMCRWEHGGPR